MKTIEIYERAIVSNTVKDTTTTIIIDRLAAHFPYGGTATISQYLLIKQLLMKHKNEADKVKIFVKIV